MAQLARVLRDLGEQGTPFDRVSFVVVDLETTGISAVGGDRVTEVAAVVVEGGRVAGSFQSLINPERRIPPYVTQLTGITNAMVRRAPIFRDVAGELAQHLVGRVFVAHNASFDWRFLAAEYSRTAGGSIEALVESRLCTVRLARRFLRHLPRRNLDAVAAYYGVPIEGRHRAEGDARATAHVLLGLLRDAERAGVYTWDVLEEVMARRTARAKRRRSALPRWSDRSAGA